MAAVIHCCVCNELHAPPVCGLYDEKISGEHDPDRALHYSDGKSGVDQIPPDVLLEVGDVYTYGEKKYFRDNWKKGNDWHQFYGSALRHIFKFWDGEDIDPESGQPHLAHAIWNLITLRYYQKQRLGTDDRDPNLIYMEPEEDREHREV